MLKKLIFTATLTLAPLTGVFAGGMLTNTNQNTTFLRNPARDGSIGIDSVYSNPAGISFMDEGSYLSLNWQAAYQKRIIKTSSTFLDKDLTGNTATKEYKGDANSKFIPSIQYANNRGKWSFQFNFGINGGGGKLRFDNGLGTFENAVGEIGMTLKKANLGSGYNVRTYMNGKQNYYGFTVGSSYKVNKHVAVYGGIRALVGDVNYHAHVDDIQVKTISGQNVPFDQFLDNTNAVLTAQINAATDPIQKAQLQGVQQEIQKLEVYRNGVNLRSDQKGHGFAPILGIDLNYDKFNFGAKYEFKTKMKMKNNSTLKQALAIPAINTFIDQTDMHEDTPALLALGAEWELKPELRFSLGYHHYYDKAANKSYCYYDENKTPVISHHKNSDHLSHGANEYLAGIEYDVNSRLTLSTGAQITRYGLTDSYMSDISFVVNSWSLGLGAKYKLNENEEVQLAYFKTFYKDYNMADGSNTYTRKNNVIGIGYDYKFK